MKCFQRVSTALAVIALAGCAGTGSISKRMESAATSAGEQQAKKEASMPRCDRPIGTVTIVTPEKNWWQAYRLESPDALIKLYAAQSNCFTILDRGAGFAVAERERALAAGGSLQAGANIGGGQVKAADYVITPDVVVSNNNAGGSAVGAILGSFIPIPGLAMIASQMNLSDKSAEVTLAVTDVRTSEQVIVARGKAEKSDIGFGAGGAFFTGGGFGAGGVSSYANTAVGQVVAIAYLDAYASMVSSIRQLRPAEAPRADSIQAVPPAVQPQTATMAASARPVAMAKFGHLFRGPSVTSGSIRELPPGSILYPAGKKSGTWLEVTDDSGQKGWVSSSMLGK